MDRDPATRTDGEAGGLEIYFDGSLNLEGAGAGVIFISPQGDHLKYVLQIHYKASNNGAKYKALIHGLRIAVSLGIKHLITYGDSKVVIDPGQ
jgi:ribonuclease HI